MTQIVGTPLEIALWYVPKDSSPPAIPNPLLSEAGYETQLGLGLIGQLPSTQQTEALQELRTPFDQLFNQAWSGLVSQGTPQQALQQALQSKISNAYNINSTFPSSGTLDAQCSPPGIPVIPQPPTWPPGSPGQLLTLQFSLQSPVSITWNESVGFPWNIAGDPSYTATFDGALTVQVAVPADPTLGLVVLSASFQATNVSGSLDGFSIANLLEVVNTALSFTLNLGWDLLTFQPLPSLPSNSIPNQNVPVTNQSLAQTFDLLSVGFALVATQGFKQLSVQVNGLAQPPSWPQPVNRVEFDLTHPFDPGPTAQAGQVGLIGPGPPQMSASPGVVAAGTQFAVTGANFPAQATQLTIGWTDTTSGPVYQSEVQWGAVLPTPAGVPLNVQVLGDKIISRSGPLDGGNTFTTPNDLTPGTQYAFRVRDYDLGGLVATAWGEWVVLTTGGTDQVLLLLDDAAGTDLGTYTVQPDGAFSLPTVLMPASVLPGNYRLWAWMGSQTPAFAPITVSAEGQPAKPQLAVFNPETGITDSGVAYLAAGLPVSLQGYNFQPGPVGLFIGSSSGQSLGSATASATASPGHPAGSFTATSTWPENTAGPLSIVAVQGGSVVASVPVFGEAIN